jgi:hypothetical protein
VREHEAPLVDRHLDATVNLILSPYLQPSQPLPGGSRRGDARSRLVFNETALEAEL